MSSLTVSYSYVPQVTETIVLFGDDSNFAPGNTIAQNTHNAAAAINPAGIQQYPGYDSYYSALEGRATQLQCDTVYKWTLVQYSETTSVLAIDPCSDPDVSSTSLCISLATTANADNSDSTPIQKRGYFIAIMVIIAALIVIVAAFVYFRCFRKKRGGSGRTRTDVMVRDEDGGSGAIGEHKDVVMA